MKYIHLLKKIFIHNKRELLRPKIVKNHGIKLYISEHISKNLRYYFYSGLYENAEIKILSKVLETKDRVLDIGAGIGFLTIYCAKRIGNASVIAYEANPLIIDEIKRNLKLNKVNPEIRNEILGDLNSEVDFYVEDDFWSSSTIRRTEKAKSIRVKSRKINEVFSEFQPNFLIVDIEGGEINLIYQINWENINKILIELHPHVIGNYESTKIISYLNSVGFELNFNFLYSNVIYFTKRIQN